MLVGNGTDGVIVQRGATVSLRQCELTNNGTCGLRVLDGPSYAGVNGFRLSSNLYGVGAANGGNVQVTASTVSHNRWWGFVFRGDGSGGAVRGCNVAANERGAHQLVAGASSALLTLVDNVDEPEVALASAAAAAAAGLGRRLVGLVA